MRKKPTIKTPVKNLKKSETIAHYNAILIENIESNMKAVIESVEATESRLSNEMSEFRKEVNNRFEIVEGVLRIHSRDINELKTDVSGLKTDVSGLKTDVSGLKTEMHEMEQRLTEKIDKIVEKVDDHETRIIKLESASV